MRIAAVRATLVKERVLWAREVEQIVGMRALGAALEGGAPKGAPSRGMPMPGSVLVEVEADDGQVGVGLGGGGWAGTYAVEHFLAPLILGDDPLNINALWDRMYRATFRYGQAGLMLMAISGIDLALWDLRGRVTQQPVWAMLGGKCREKVPVYATVRDPEWAQAQGFCGVKLGGPYRPVDGVEGMRANEAIVAAVRERVGDDMGIMIDCSNVWTVEYTLEMSRRLAPYGVRFVEEPIPSQDAAGYARLRGNMGGIQVATGEHAYTRHGARALLQVDGVDIIQPDVRWTGGLSEMLVISQMAAGHNVAVYPHRGAMAWALHMIMARPECTVAEGLALTQEEADRSLFDGEPVPVNGYVTVSDAPGFGLELKRDKLAEFLVDY